LLSFLASRFELDLGQRKAANLDQSWISQTPVEARPYLQQLSDEYRSVQQALQAAEQGHLKDLLQFAYFAWRRPLKATQQSQLLNYYVRLRTEYEFDHPQAVRTVLARILVAPDFLYRLERPTTTSGVSVLSAYELASRLSYFLWSSMPVPHCGRPPPMAS